MTSQNQRVLNHLIDHGYITQTIANNYGIRRLAARINDLKKFGCIGYDITTQQRRDDAGVRYAYYALTDAGRASEAMWRDHGFDWQFNRTLPIAI